MNITETCRILKQNDLQDDLNNQPFQRLARPTGRPFEPMFEKNPYFIMSHK